MKTTKPKTKSNRPKGPASKPAASKPATPKAKALKAPARQAAVTTKRTNGGVVIRLHAPSALAVCVAGTFNGWKANANPLNSGDGGEWRGELPLAVGRYEYLFVVDGSWIPDPAAGESVPNEFGGLNSVILVN